MILRVASRLGYKYGRFEENMSTFWVMFCDDLENDRRLVIRLWKHFNLKKDDS